MEQQPEQWAAEIKTLTAQNDALTLENALLENRCAALIEQNDALTLENARLESLVQTQYEAELDAADLLRIRTALRDPVFVGTLGIKNGMSDAVIVEIARRKLDL